MACGDDTSNFPYNCLLAWQDSTVPNGRVLYTYFKVGAGSTIDFHPNAWIRGGSQTVGHVSAAYFADRYYLAWKRWTAPADASYTINDSTSYTGWSTVNNYDAEDIVDPPTWLYRDDDATSNGILWTEL